MSGGSRLRMLGSRPMRVVRAQRFLALMMAVILLSLSVISRAPQSKCRCGARKTTSTQESRPCVFGQMRSLTGTFVLPASVEPKDTSILVNRPLEVAPASNDFSLVGITDRPRERSPPDYVTSLEVSI
jgi:hypothetical protein